MSFQPKRIMVAFDFSEPSIGAVRYGQAIVGDGDTIQVVNIIDDNFPTYASIEYPEIIDKKQQVLRCRKMRDDLTDAGMDISNLKFQSEFGDPGTELVASYSVRSQNALRDWRHVPC
jgi:nucleotide-binding universal stress UspA family protein